MTLVRTILVLSLVSACGGGSGDPDAPPAADARGPVDANLGPCTPGAPDTWVEEGTPLALVVGCTARETAPSDVFAITNVPEGASFDAATRTLTWTPGVDDAATLTLEVTAVGETGTVKLGVLDGWADEANVPPEPTTYLEEHGLPVLHVTTSPALDYETYSPATIVYRGQTFLGEAKLRGQTSSNYPKHSYTLKFPEAQPFEEPAHGFVHRRRIAVTTTFDDNSYLRHRLAYALWNLMEPTNHVRVEQMSAVLFVDGVYQGLYAVSDQVSRHLFEAQGLDATGNLYKGDTHACNLRLLLNNGDAKTSLHQGYEKKDGTPLVGEPGAYDDLDALVSWAGGADDPTFYGELGTRLVRRDFEDWWIFVSLIEADDSAGKNSFLWHDAPTGMWRYVPWDFNASFGQTWQTEREWWEEPPMAYDWANGLWERLFVNPEINAALRVRWATALAGPLAKADVLALYDAMVEEIRPSALRDERRWGAEYAGYADWSFRLDFLSTPEEWTYTRQWISDRWDFAVVPELAFP